MKKSTLFTAFLIAAAAAASVIGQTLPQHSVSVIHDIHRITSSSLGEERTILVRVPQSYAGSTNRYPVLYMLDAHPPQNAMTAGMIEQQAWASQMPEMILVGIQNTNRTRDLTPTRTAATPAAGGGEKFLDFIQNEVIPLVEAKYRVHPYRIFAGHSLGGLFVTHTMLTRPQLFNAYIAASPVLHWDNDLLIKNGRTAFADKRDWNRVYYAAIGDEPDYQRGFDTFRELMKKSSPRNLSFDFAVYPKENHGSVVLPAYYAGLRHVFEGWNLTTVGTVADLEAHYKKLTKRFGYEIKVPEPLMNRVGYELLNAGKRAEALEVFQKNVANYPDSANTYDSLGEALERDGQIKKARENYERAYDLATKRGDAQLAAVYKTNLDRVSAKQ